MKLCYIAAVALVAVCLMSEGVTADEKKDEKVNISIFPPIQEPPAASIWSLGLDRRRNDLGWPVTSPPGVVTATLVSLSQRRRHHSQVDVTAPATGAEAPSHTP